MAKQDLYKTAQQSAKLFKLINENQQLEGWVSAKISKAAEDISTVYQYLSYEKQFQDYSKMIAESTDLSDSKRAMLTSKLMEAKDKVKALKKKAAEDKAKKVEEGFEKDAAVGSKKKTPTGELTKTSTGVTHKNTSYADGGDDDIKPKSGKGIKTHAKALSADKKKDMAPKQKQSPKSAKTWGMKDSEKFDHRDKEVSESKGKCNETAKGKSCPVHGLKECGSMYEAARTMSRAAKGHEKYGKEGMAALSKAGKEGKSLEPVKAKYNKYDEGKLPMKKVNGKSVPAFAADGKGKNDLAKSKAGVKEAISRAKDMLEGKAKKKDKIDMEGGNAFGLAVRNAKKDGVQKGEKIKVGGKEIPLKESADFDRMKQLMTRLNG